jgi:hypothetical protein
MHQLRIGNLGRQPLSDLETTPFDECLSVGRKEFVQHSARLSPFLSSFCTVPHIDAPADGATQPQTARSRQAV